MNVLDKLKQEYEYKVKVVKALYRKKKIQKAQYLWEMAFYEGKLEVVEDVRKVIPEKDKIITMITDRISDEYCKHKTLDWQRIVAIKIYDDLEYLAGVER